MMIEVMRVGSREVYRRKSGFGERISLCLYCFLCGFMFAWMAVLAFRLFL